MSELRQRLTELADALAEPLRTGPAPSWLLGAIQGCYTELRTLAMTAERADDPAVVAAITRTETLLEVCGIAPPTGPQSVIPLPAPAPSPPKQASRGDTVLVVEDDADVRRAVRGVIEDAGYRVVEAKNGKEALSLLQHIDPAIILLDLMMPVMNGWDFIQRMRAVPAWSAIPVAVLTAAMSRLGAVGHVAAALKKPLDLEAIVDVVTRYAQPRAGYG